MSVRPSFRRSTKDVAAEALEEVEPKVQKAIVESLDSGRAADIVEEMDPDAAADLLGDLPEERTEQILVQMEPEAQQDVVELLEHREETAAGRMTTEFLALPVAADRAECHRFAARVRGRGRGGQHHLPGGFSRNSGRSSSTCETRPRANHDPHVVADAGAARSRP